MYTQNTMDMIEQSHESMARACVANYIGAKNIWQTGVTASTEGYTGEHVVKLLTMYNTENGTKLTANDVRKAENFPNFYKWACAKIMTYMDFFTERTTRFHANITGKEIARHTPLRMQNIMIFSQLFIPQIQRF